MKLAFLFSCCLFLSGCYTVRIVNTENEENQKRAAKGVKDFSDKFTEQGTLPQSRDAKANGTLASSLSNSLGPPQVPIDINNDAQIASVKTELDTYKKNWDNTVSILWGLGSLALTLLVGGGSWITKLKGALGAAKGEAEEMWTQYKGQLVGTSQLKATYEHAKLVIMDMAKIDVNKALQMALNLIDRDNTNYLLKNGAEAAGGSSKLESYLTEAKDEIEQGLLNRPLIDPKILMNG